MGSGVARPGDPTPGLGEGSRTDSSGGWVIAEAEIDLDPPAPVEPPAFDFGPKPRQTPIPREELGISIDDERDGTVCRQEAHLKRQHPTSNDSQNPYLRGKLTVSCPCGGDTPAVIVVAITTGERAPRPDSRRMRDDTPPPYPSRFESDIATILANVQITWTGT